MGPLHLRSYSQTKDHAAVKLFSLTVLPSSRNKFEEIIYYKLLAGSLSLDPLESLGNIFGKLLGISSIPEKVLETP